MHQLLFFKKRYEAWPHPNGGTEKPVSPARAADSHSASKYMLPHFVFSWGVWGLCRTRLAEQKNLSAPHALLRRAYPNERAVEPANFARDVDNRFARKHMLAQSLLAEPAFYP